MPSSTGCIPHPSPARYNHPSMSPLPPSHGGQAVDINIPVFREDRAIPDCKGGMPMIDGAPAAHRGGPRTACPHHIPAQQHSFLANHRKLWDGKVMGTKVSNIRAYPKQIIGTMSARPLEKPAPRPKGRSAKLSGTKVRRASRAAHHVSQPPDHCIRIFHRKEEII